MKTLQGPQDTEFTDRNYDRVRRDVLIQERLSGSPYLLDIYGHCGFTFLVPYGSEGTMHEEVWYGVGDDGTMTPLRKLEVATEAVGGIKAIQYDIHSLGNTEKEREYGDGRECCFAPVTHGDLKLNQYLMVDGVYRLNDFNRGRFLRYDVVKKEPCPYTIGHNDGKFRSPEEYKYEPQTSAVDVWPLGSIIHIILFGEEVWEGYKEKDAQKLIMKGELPPLLQEPFNHTDDDEKGVGSKAEVDLILKKAIEMCFVYDPKERYDAKQVYEYLNGELERIKKGIERGKD